MEPDPPNRLPDAIRDVIAGADRFELLSLDPDGGSTREAGHFWGWRVLGSVVVGSPDRDMLVSALEQGIAENGGVVIRRVLHPPARHPGIAGWIIGQSSGLL